MPKLSALSDPKRTPAGGDRILALAVVVQIGIYLPFLVKFRYLTVAFSLLSVLGATCGPSDSHTPKPGLVLAAELSAIRS
jgi:hypothetical protein